MANNAVRVCSVVVVAAMLAIGTPAAVLAQAPPTGVGGQSVVNKRINLDLQNADIRYALKLLFDSAGVNYTLDQAVQGTVTVSLHDVPFQVALESILRSVNSQMPLTYRVENGVYTVSPRVEEVTPPANVGAIETPAPPQLRTVKIPLIYADAIDIATALGGTYIVSRFARMNTGTSGGYGNGFGNGGFGGGYGGFGNNFGGGGFGGGGFGGGGFGGGNFGGGFGGIGGGNFGGGFGGGMRGF